MATVLDRLNEFSRKRADQLGSDDPQEVLRAEDELRDVWNLDTVEQCALLPDRPSRRTTGLLAGGVVGTAVRVVGPRVALACASAFGGFIGSPAVSRTNRGNAWVAEDCVPTLSTVAVIESQLLQANSKKSDWRVVALNYGPTFEATLRDPLFELAAARWDAHAHDHPFYGPVLSETFVSKRSPTLVTFEAMLHMLEHADASDDRARSARPLSVRYYSHPRLVSWVQEFRRCRNTLHHHRSKAWTRKEYSEHCRLLFGKDSLNGWLGGDFLVDGSGALATASHSNGSRNLFGALIVQKFLWRRLPGLSIDEAVDLVNAGVLEPDDPPPAWLDRAATEAGFREASLLVRARLAREAQFGPDWRAAKIEAMGVETALAAVRDGLARPEEFGSSWVDRHWPDVSWTQALRLAEARLVRPSALVDNSRPDRIRRLRAIEAAEALKDSTLHAEELDASWRAREVSCAGWKERQVLIDAGLATRGDFGPDWVADRLLSTSATEVRRLVRQGALHRTEIPASWRAERAASASPSTAVSLLREGLLFECDFEEPTRVSLSRKATIRELRELLSTEVLQARHLMTRDIVSRLPQMGIDDVLAFLDFSVLEPTSVSDEWRRVHVKRASKKQACRLVHWRIAALDDFPLAWRAMLTGKDAP